MDSPKLPSAADDEPASDKIKSLIITDNMEHHSVLERLPSELVWRIMEFAPEAVFELRLTSRLLRNLVDAFGSLRATIPIVEKMKIFVSSKERLSFVPDICFYVPKSVSNLFELRLKLNQFPTEFRANIKLCGRCSDENRHHVYRLNFTMLVDNESALNGLRACMGSRIEKVDAMLYDCSDPAALIAAHSLLEGIRFGQLNIWVGTLSEDIENYLLRTSIMNNVEHLSISAGNVTISDPVELLLHLSSLLTSLHIEQNVVREIDRKDSYFFGLYDQDWAPIFLRMFEGKLDKFHIENYFFSEYLSNRSADLLRERLPTLGKKLWFSATCSKNYANKSAYKDNEHVVKAGRDKHVNRRPGTPRPHSLSVKHQTRESEHFDTFYPLHSAFHSMP